MIDLIPPRRKIILNIDLQHRYHMLLKFLVDIVPEIVNILYQTGIADLHIGLDEAQLANNVFFFSEIIVVHLHKFRKLILTHSLELCDLQNGVVIDQFLG